MSRTVVPGDELGPVDVVVVGFPDGVPHPEGFDLLLGLVDRGAVRILDVEFVIADAAGRWRAVPAADLPAVAGFDAALWAGADSGLLDRDDVAQVGARLTAGELAAVIVIEQRWLEGVVGAWRGSGARLLMESGVPAQGVVDALDAAERRDATEG